MHSDSSKCSDHAGVTSAPQGNTEYLGTLSPWDPLPSVSGTHLTEVIPLESKQWHGVSKMPLKQAFLPQK